MEIPDSIKQHLAAKCTEKNNLIFFFLWHSDLNNRNFMHGIHQYLSAYSDFDSQTRLGEQSNN